MEAHSAIETAKNWLESIARTTASMAIAMRVMDHSMVSWESARQGQRSEEATRGNRAAVQRLVVMSREPNVRIQPSTYTSRRGSHLLRALLRAVPLCRSFTWKPLFLRNDGPSCRAGLDRI